MPTQREKIASVEILLDEKLEALIEKKVQEAIEKQMKRNSFICKANDDERNRLINGLDSDYNCNLIGATKLLGISRTTFFSWLNNNLLDINIHYQEVPSRRSPAGKEYTFTKSNLQKLIELKIFLKRQNKNG